MLNMLTVNDFFFDITNLECKYLKKSQNEHTKKTAQLFFEQHQ